MNTTIKGVRDGRASGPGGPDRLPHRAGRDAGLDRRPQDLTLILGRARAGDERARGEVLGLVYDELRRVATGLMRRERPDHTLPPTAVVHEAVIRLLGEAIFDKAADGNFLFASAARAIGVSTRLGEIELAVMPLRASSRASALVSARTPPFDAA